MTLAAPFRLQTFVCQFLSESFPSFLDHVVDYRLAERA